MRKSEHVKISRQALRNVAITLELALAALGDDEADVGTCREGGFTPRESIQRQIEVLRVMADGLGVLREDG